MASLRQKGDGRYFIDYRVDGQRKYMVINIDGRPCRDAAMAMIYFDTWRNSQPEAEEKPEESTKGVRIARVIDYYRDTHLYANNSAQATHRSAATHCEAFRDFCRSQNIGNTQQLSKELMSRWTVHLLKDRGARTAINYITTIRAAINAAVDAEIIPDSPIRGRWQLPKTDPVERHPLDATGVLEVRHIFRDVPVIQWICLTGNRPSDARMLRFRDVDLTSGTVDRGHGKPRAIRKYEICRAAVALVSMEATRKHRDDDIVFLSRNYAPWSGDGLLNSFKARLRSVEYHRDLNLRDLRHSFATIMANDIGVPLPELQILMGHSDIATTMKYVRARGARSWLDTWDNTICPDE